MIPGTGRESLKIFWRKYADMKSLVLAVDQARYIHRKRKMRMIYHIKYLKLYLINLWLC